MSLIELRRNDYSLDEDMAAVRDLFEDFFRSEVPTSRVRAAEPLGFDEHLWKSVCTIGVVGMGLPTSAGGDGAGLATVALAAEQQGARLGPVPLVSQVAAARLLGQACASPSTPSSAREVLDAVVAGDRIVALAPEPVVAGRRQLLPDGAIARHVLAIHDDDLVLYDLDAPVPLASNESSLPQGWWDPDTAETPVTLAAGDLAAAAVAQARAEIAVLTAAALVGMTQTALDIACEFTRTRYTMGVPIGSLQGVAFPLTDVAINIDGSRNLARKAAWLLDEEAADHLWLARAALVAATRTATHGTTTSAHMQGGLGFTVEADASLYFLRAKGWAAQAGHPATDLSAIGRQLLDRDGPR